MGQALYRKYRSKSFEEVVGQEHVTKTLSNALKQGRVSHAYLFTGPRGVGKTSVARILAHEVNGLNYVDESTHLDIIEIDAASNRRIDEIRDLREKVHTAPANAKFKVYIIDEVHMLTREAFNALLKTLEEPPAHCIFILATTESHKLPETIVSRTQKFSFKPIGRKGVAEHLSAIAKKEKIDIDKEALELIAEHGEGSFRDSIGILDQLSSLDRKITAEEVLMFLGLPGDESVKRLAEAISDGKSSAALKTLFTLKEQGASAPKIASQLAKKLRQQLIDGDYQPWIPELLRQLLLVSGSSSPFDQLEIAILEAASKNTKTSSPDDSESKPKSRTEQKNERSKTNENKNSHGSAAAFSLEVWPEIVEHVKQEAASLYTALRLASPELQDGRLVLFFQFPLHQKKVSQARCLDLIGRIIEKHYDVKIPIVCKLDKSRPPAEETVKADAREASPSKADLATISNIFGSAEVLES